MKLEKIYFEELFPIGPYANQRLYLEASVGEYDDILECYGILKNTVEEAFKKHNPNIGEVHQTDWKPETKLFMEAMGDSPKDFPYNLSKETMTIQTKEKRKEEVVASLMLAIELASSKTATEFFRKRVQDINDEKLTEAFNNKMKQFESPELIQTTKQ